MIRQQNNIEKVILPVRDGIMLIRKLRIPLSKPLCNSVRTSVLILCKCLNLVSVIHTESYSVS